MKNNPNQLLNLILCILFFNPFFTQNDSQNGIQEVDRYLSEEDYKKADSCLNAQINTLKQQNNLDSLLDYIYYVGSVELNNSNEKKAERKVMTFITELNNLTEDNRTKKQIYIEIASFYELLNDSETAYRYSQKARDIAFSLPDKKGAELGLIENNMGVYSTRMGNIKQATNHVRRGNKYYLGDPDTDPDDLYLSTSTMGNMMWYNSKYDSAYFYYQKALELLKKLEPTPYNKYYRAALLLNNSSGIHNINGKTSQSIKAMENAIKHLQQYLASEIPDLKKKNAQEFFYQMIDNLGGAYKDQGNLKRAKDLIYYAYQQKNRLFDQGSPEVYKGNILMGQIELALRNFKEAEDYLIKGIELINKSPHPNLFWIADAHYYLGVVYDYSNQTDNALNHYQLAEEYFEEANEGVFDEIYLDFVKHAAPFYAKNGHDDKALSLSKKALEYIHSVSEEENLLIYYQKLNIGEVNFNLQKYEEAIEHCSDALLFLENNLYENATKIDTIQIDFLKPLTVYLIEKSKYKLSKERDTETLKNSYNNLNEVIDLLGRQKSVSTDEYVTSVLISDFDAVFEFTKLLAYELYLNTGEEQYLNKIISLNESTLYNKIRTRLGIHESAKYVGIPDDILATEKELKANLNEALKESQNVTIDDFLIAEKRWIEFINKLENQYPKYYKLKYASIEESLYNVSDNIPNETTIVRYLFIEDDLFVVVIDKNTKKIIPLDYTNVKDDILALQKGTLDFESSSEKLHNLYQALWLPLEKDVLSDYVIVVPDAELFNLSFESLTKVKANTSTEQIEQCLLNKHIISYNYSLYLLEKNKSKFFYENDFIAFAPEFTDKMKSDYQFAINDSVQIDRTYLTLLPQPHNLDLAKRFSKLFNGTSFLNEKSTAQVFVNSASEHKIIHIGTHAESNNVTPELSRLIFAKNIDDTLGIEDNSLYTYEIYNTNLSSNLAILTACETGKPTYQAGEGMISLAHAFNYAGSESILTSLWKIDEQSSAEIIELFYKNLTTGIGKDRALQQAKLEYLKTAKGRTANPEYWAGLILIGDTSPIEIGSDSTSWWWLIGGILLIMVFWGVRKLRS